MDNLGRYKILRKISWLWFIFAIFFATLALMHFALSLQQDIQVPTYRHVELTSSGKFAAVDENGNYIIDPSNPKYNLMVDPIEELSKFSMDFEKFINNDFTQVVVNINDVKRKSNRFATIAHTIACLTCLFSFWFARRKLS